uniref:Glucosyltransferase 24 catalytic domain-containing protein n=1 Tax=Amphimedon queenslandica TaxID=400682 RepID=A0A1X7TGE8_AMPQE
MEAETKARFRILVLRPEVLYNAMHFQSQSKNSEPSLREGRSSEVYQISRIMMLSVLKHTKNPVKFWFLKNYLSPQFKDFIPRMAERYGFEYELVVRTDMKELLEEPLDGAPYGYTPFCDSRTDMDGFK